MARTAAVTVEVSQGISVELCYAILTRSPEMSFATDSEGVTVPFITLPRPEWDALFLLAQRALEDVQAR